LCKKTLDIMGICPTITGMDPDQIPAKMKSPRRVRTCSATALRKASRRVTQLYDSILAPSGLRSTQYAILTELERNSQEPPTLQELADALVMDRSALGHTLQPLERDGLITSQPSVQDRRRRLLVLTPLGLATVREIRPLWLKAQKHFDQIYGEIEAAALRASLIAIATDERLDAAQI
jgi:DNA-binding MarR family transcriptional regulator